MPILLLIGLLFSPLARAEDLDYYRQLQNESLDDPEQARQHAADDLDKNPVEANDRLWLQSYLYLLANDPERLPKRLLGQEPMKKALDDARSRSYTDIELPLAYQLERAKLQDTKGTPEQFSAVDRQYMQLAREQKLYRFMAALAITQAFNAYNAGDMKTALQITQDSMRELDKTLSPRDSTMLTLRLNSAMFLEYVHARDKAIEVYQAVINDLRALKGRWSIADALFNYAVALMNVERYAEAQLAFREVQATGLLLKSKILQGRALKGLGYAQQKMKQYRPAIDSYERGIVLMKEGKEDPVAVADTYKLMADCYKLDKQYHKALKAVEIAVQEPTAMQDKNWEKGLENIRIDAYAGLGQMKEALRSAKRVTQLLDEIHVESQSQEISKLKISMGLEIEEQKNELLTGQNKMQAEKLQNAELIRRFFFGLLLLSVLVIVLLGVSLKQTLRVKKSRERVHRILEHIEEGILSIGSGMRVEADLSPYLARLLGFGETSRQPMDMFAALLEVADLQADERATIKAALSASLGEDELSWELNRAQLPLAVTIQSGSKNLSLEWQPIYDEQRRVQNILMTVRDATARHRLQTEVAHARAHASRLEQRLVDILQIDARAAESFVNEARRILPDLRPKLEQTRDLALCYRQLHTLKGMARSLGFKEMSSLVHTMEDQLDLENKVIRQRGEAMHILGEIERTVNEYREIIEKVYFRQSEAAGGEASSLVDLVAASIVPVRSMLEQAGLELARVDIQDHVPHWTREQLDAAQLLLLHGMTNCADHGFILPRRKGREVEKAAALSVKAWQTPEALHIELSDNGIGLDLDQLAEVAERSGFIPQAEQTVADVVFEDGTSTADEVSMSSGRGMGLSAIRQSVESLQGSVHFKPNPSGSGSCLLATIPRSLSKAA